jgi:hypothetical protein
MRNTVPPPFGPSRAAQAGPFRRPIEVAKHRLLPCPAIDPRATGDRGLSQSEIESLLKSFIEEVKKVQPPTGAAEQSAQSGTRRPALPPLQSEARRFEWPPFV